MKRLPITLFLFIALLLAFAGCAAAEEELAIGTAELYSAGSFAAPAALPRTYAAQTFEEVLTEYLNSRSEEILNLAEFNLDYETEFLPMYQAVLNRHPEWFYVDKKFGIRTSDDDDGDGVDDSTEENLKGPVRLYQAIYKYTGDELADMTAVYNNGIAAVVDYALEADTTVGRILRANDYLCANYKYDVDLNISSPELFFKDGKGVCQAYMLAFDAVMQELGVECETVTSDAMNHTWNQVKVDGKWYHVDTTWNDALSNNMDIPYRAFHDNLLLSDDALIEQEHYDWNALASSTSTTYDDFFWTFIQHPAGMLGDTVYYADDAADTTKPILYSYDLETNTRTKILEYTTSAFEHYHPVWVANDLLFYTKASKLYIASLEGSHPALIYQADEGTYIHSFYQEGDSLKMHVSSKPSVRGKIMSVNLNSFKISPQFAEMAVGDTLQFSAPPASSSSFTWSSSDSDVASISESGLVTAHDMGVVTITFTTDRNSTNATVLVHSADPFILPASLKTISENAFAGLPVEEVVLPDTVESIGANAFAGCEGLYLINLPEPENGLAISPTAFAGCDNLTLLCSSDEAVDAAEALGIPAIRLP